MSGGSTLTTIRTSPGFSAHPGNYGDTMLAIGTAATSGAKVPFFGGPSLYGTRKAALLPFRGDATVLKLVDATAAGPLRAKFMEDGGGCAFVFTAPYWRKEFDDFRLLQGTVARITSFRAEVNEIELEFPIGFGNGTSSMTRTAVVAIFSKGDYNGQSNIYDPSLPVAPTALIDPYIGYDNTIRDLMLVNEKSTRPPIMVLGGYNILLQNLDLTGDDIVGGNAITRSIFEDTTGTFRTRVMDIGFVWMFNEFRRWSVQRDAATSSGGKAMFQCRESSGKNHCSKIDVLGPVGMYRELFRLQSVRDTRLEDMTLTGDFTRAGIGIVELNHLKECFLFLYPIAANFNPMGGLTIGTASQSISMSTPVDIQDRGLKVKGALMISWAYDPNGAAFAAAALPGTLVTDTTGKGARVIYGLKATYPVGTIANYRDKLYKTQLEIWNGESYPTLTVTAGTGIGHVFTVIDLIQLDDGTAWFGYSVDTDHPELGFGTAFTCSLFTGVTFTPVSGVIDDDNEKLTLGSKPNQRSRSPASGCGAYF